MNLEQLQKDIDAFLAKGKKIEHVPRGVMKLAPDTSGNWQDESQRHSFTISKSRNYEPQITEDGEPKV
jgi:hypothetical protein